MVVGERGLQPAGAFSTQVYDRGLNGAFLKCKHTPCPNSHTQQPGILCPNFWVSKGQALGAEFA